MFITDLHVLNMHITKTVSHRKGLHDSEPISCRVGAMGLTRFSALSIQGKTNSSERLSSFFEKDKSTPGDPVDTQGLGVGLGWELNRRQQSAPRAPRTQQQRDGLTQYVVAELRESELSHKHAEVQVFVSHVVQSKPRTGIQCSQECGRRVTEKQRRAIEFRRAQPFHRSLTIAGVGEECATDFHALKHDQADTIRLERRFVDMR
ncbi:MAG: hypothetical protein U5Q16_04490 [Gammaproteobacteria bacterium]|nr:hypothetical protein [Gammaproteobacteria bacterium]